MANGETAASPNGVDEARLTSAVYALDPIVALLALVHLTGDRLLLASLGKAFDGVPRANQNSFRPTELQNGPQADPARELTGEGLRQQQHVVAPLPERREREGKNRNPHERSFEMAERIPALSREDTVRRSRA